MENISNYGLVILYPVLVLGIMKGNLDLNG